MTASLYLLLFTALASLALFVFFPQAWVWAAVAGVLLLVLCLPKGWVLLTGLFVWMGFQTHPAAFLVAAVLVAWNLTRPGPTTQGEKLRQRVTRDVSDLNRLTWQELEQVIAAAYRRYGWKVATTGTSAGGSSDGGVDILLTRGRSDRCLVQCKKWKGRVGVKPVRELMGLLSHHQAQRGVIVATGGFTKEAWEFVRGKPIDLITGPRLLDLLAARPEGSGEGVDSNRSMP